MNTRIWSSVCAASVFALTVGVFGQAGAPPQQPASSSMKAVTIGGCIQRQQTLRRGRADQLREHEIPSDQSRDDPGWRDRHCRVADAFHRGGQRVSTRLGRGEADAARRSQGRDHGIGRGGARDDSTAGRVRRERPDAESRIDQDGRVDLLVDRAVDVKRPAA